MPTMINKNCERCGNGFIVTPKQKDQRFCSKLCSSRATAHLRGTSVPKFTRAHTLEERQKIASTLRRRYGTDEIRTCPWCKQGFSVKAGAQRKYCSRSCSGKAQPQRGWRAGLSDRMKGSGNISWKGGRTVLGSGYIGVRTEGKYKLEHRIVMERILGRPLTKEEQVHHKDGNRQNNDPSNLELRSGPHGAGATKHCPTCTCC